MLERKGQRIADYLYRRYGIHSASENAIDYIADMHDLEFDIAVGGIRFQRKFSMPNKWTFSMKPVSELLQEEIKSGIWVDPFAGQTDLRQICPDIKQLVSNDINPKSYANHHLDALEFLSTLPEGYYDGAVLDWPYNLNQYRICYQEAGVPVNKKVYNAHYQSQVKNYLSKIIKPGGKCICFGWNTMGLGINRGFEMTRVRMIPHGRMHNDTLVTVEIKKKSQ